MKVDIHLHLDQSFARRLDAIISIARNISTKQDAILMTLQDIVDDVAAEATAIDSLVVFIKGLQDQIAAIPGITPAMQAQIDGIFASVEKNKASVMAAMAPAVVEPPPVVV